MAYTFVHTGVYSDRGALIVHTTLMCSPCCCLYSNEKVHSWPYSVLNLQALDADLPLHAICLATLAAAVSDNTRHHSICIRAGYHDHLVNIVSVMYRNGVVLLLNGNLFAIVI